VNDDRESQNVRERELRKERGLLRLTRCASARQIDPYLADRDDMRVARKAIDHPENVRVPRLRAVRMNTDRDPHGRVTTRDENVAFAGCEILGAREHTLDARRGCAREHGVEIIDEAAVVEMRVGVDHARRGQAVFARSRRGKSAGPVRTGSPGRRTPHFATSVQRARSGASTPSCSAMRALTFGVYG
jgi:hypothetical protein